MQEKTNHKREQRDSVIIIGILVSVFIISAAILYPVAAYAQETDERFVEYSFTYSALKTEESRVGGGNLRLEVVENLGNGTLRIEISGSMNNAEFLIRNNVAEERFHFPYLPTLPQLDQTITGENGTITITTERLSDEEVDFQGSRWILNVTKITLEVEGTRNSEGVAVNADGELKIFADSGLLYSFTGSFDRESGDTETQVSVILVDTNLDLGVKPESSLSILSQANALAGLGMGGIPFDDQAVSTQSSDVTETYLLIGTLITAIVLVSVLSVLNRRRGEGEDTSGEKPLHWVH